MCLDLEVIIVKYLECMCFFYHFCVQMSLRVGSLENGLMLYTESDLKKKKCMILIKFYCNGIFEY